MSSPIGGPAAASPSRIRRIGRDLRSHRRSNCMARRSRNRSRAPIPHLYRVLQQQGRSRAPPRPQIRNSCGVHEPSRRARRCHGYLAILRSRDLHITPVDASNAENCQRLLSASGRGGEAAERIAEASRCASRLCGKELRQELRTGCTKSTNITQRVERESAAVRVLLRSLRSIRKTRLIKATARPKRP